jgi:3-deoxy-manno-octulosonate cytidylyltransferase (CMP-KDO synthetase)
MSAGPPPDAVIAVIPARHASTRFPGKMLSAIAGKPLIQRVWEQVRQCQRVGRVVIATDHTDIETAARSFGAEVVMTSAEAASGTDRVAEVVKGIEESWVVNVQGDEPLIDPDVLDSMISQLGPSPMATLARERTDVEGFRDPNQVKVVRDSNGNALYFSRSPIPHDRDNAGGTWWHHIGVYAYRVDVLQRLVTLPPSDLEVTERLEQLRALQNGIAIQVIPTTFESIGVDTPDDVAIVEARIYDRSS